MNLAFSAAVLSFLAMPGFLFWYGYGIQERAQASAEWDSTFTQLVKGLVTAAVLHALWASLAEFVARQSDLSVDLDAVFALVAGPASGDRHYGFFHNAVKAVTQYPLRVFAYFVTLYAASVVLGITLRWAIRAKRIDHKLAFFRYSPWYYIFDEYPGTGAKKKDVFIAATIDHDDGTYLYRGFLAAYDLDRQKQLMTLRLKRASRRKLTDDRTPESDSAKTAEPAPLAHNMTHDPRYYLLRGAFVVLDFSKVATMTVTYVTVTLKPLQPPAPQTTAGI